MVLFAGNRSVANIFGGVLVSGGNSFDASGSGEALDSVAVTINHNDLSNSNQGRGFSFGIRLFVIRRDPPDPEQQTSGTIIAKISGNRISNNWFGVSIDGGFPYRTFNGIADPREYTGFLDLDFDGNQSFGNVQSAMITFERNTATLHPAQMDPTKLKTTYKYLSGAQYHIRFSDGTLDGYWLDHPAIDPIDGRPLVNHLFINHVEIANGRTAPILN